MHVVDALAITGDEGRGSLRKVSGSWQASFDPGMSEWGNPPALRELHHTVYYAGTGTQEAQNLLPLWDDRAHHRVEQRGDRGEHRSDEAHRQPA